MKFFFTTCQSVIFLQLNSLLSIQSSIFAPTNKKRYMPQNLPQHKAFMLSDFGMRLYRVTSPQGEDTAVAYSHQDDYYIFGLMEKGTGCGIIDFKEQHFSSGDVFLIQPRQVHRFISSENAEGWFLMADSSFVGSAEKRIFDDFALFSSFQIDKRRRNELSQIASLLAVRVGCIADELAKVTARRLTERYNLGDDFVVVADSGLMSADNVRLLRDAGYKYIIGARIKSEKKPVKDWILKQEKKDDSFFECRRDDGERLIVGYSETRAKKDAYNRSRGVQRLRKACSSGKLTKNQVNRRGYNKFLEISKDIEVSISEDKIVQDSKWDGLKGYITNTDFDADRVVSQYHGLWVVERAFRISKGALEMRPMFHFTERRIEAHVCICFVAYKVYKELERIIKLAGIKMSVGEVINTAKTIITIRVNMPENRDTYVKTLFLTPKQRVIEPLFGLTNLRLGEDRVNH